MAEIVLVLGKLAFAAVGLGVGVKLAADARARGAIGIHTVALAAICIGGIGMLVMPAATQLESPGLMLTSEVAVRIAMLLLCAFIAATFRPGPLGVAAAVACGALVVASLVWDVLAQPSIIAYDYAQPSSHANQLSIAAPFAWSAVESGLLWLGARRRLKLGLCDAALVHRFLLWSVTTACFVAICLLAITNGLAAAGGASTVADLAQATRGLLYLVIAGCIWQGIFASAAEASTAPSMDA